MDNITLLGIGIIIIWLLLFGYYFYVSRQQGDVLEEVHDLEKLLGGNNPDEE